MSTHQLATNGPRGAERAPGRVSFVIPTRDNARTIFACVASARAQEGDVEVIVVDNSSGDGTRDLARQAGADIVIVAGPERSAQRNRGAELATGDYVVFIDSDMVIEAGVAADVRRQFDEASHVGAVVLPETAFGEGYLARCRALEKRLYLGLSAAEAARAYRSRVFDDVGGYDESVTGLEDYELPDRVQSAGWTVGRTRVGVRHDEGRVSLPRLWRKKRYYGSRCSLDPTSFRRRRLLRLPLRPLVLVCDPVHVPGLAVLKVVDIGGLAAGYWMARRRPA